MRKRKLAFVFVLLLIMLSGLVSVASASVSSDWPMFRYDLSRSGVAASGNSSNSAQLIWSFPTSASVWSSPASADGVVVVGCKDCHIYCLNASTGAEVWRFQTGHEVNSSPAIYGGCVYVGCDDGCVYCMNITSGQPVWVVEAGGMVRSSPAVVDSCVYVGSGTGGFYCFNASNGDVIWNFPINNRVASSPAVGNGIVYFGSDDNYFYALNASSGEKIWSRLTYSQSASPCLSNGLLYVGSYFGQVYCLNASSGDVVWQYLTQDTVISCPAAAYGCVFVGSEDRYVYCLNASDGQRVWQTPTGYFVCSSPAVADGCIYVGSEDYRIYCLDAYSGAVRWSFETGSIVDSSPAIVDDVLYVGSSDYHLYAFKLQDAAVQTTKAATALPWTTVVFDVLMAAVWAVVLAFVIRYLYRRQKAEHKISTTAQSWFMAHVNALCALLILVFAVTFYLSLNAGPLWAADEKTYSQMAYHMTVSGDYFMPWSFGEQAVWVGKPPLLMWLMAVSYQFLGVSNFASRVWMPLFGVLSLAAVFFLGKKLFNAGVGVLSVAILGTFMVFYQFSTRAMTDGPLVFFMLASIYFALAGEEKHSIRLGALSGAFFGLALMTKQLEALLIPLILVVYWLATKRSLRFVVTKRFAAYWGIAAAIFLPWVAYMNMRFRDFWDCYFTYANVSRIVSPLEGHSGDYLFYFNYLFSSEPWAYLLPFAVGLCIYNVAVKRSKSDMLVLWWMLVVFGLFTFAQTKLYWYILPAVPAFALAIANLLYQSAVKIKRARSRRSALVL